MRIRKGFPLLLLAFQSYIRAEEVDDDSLRDVRELFLVDGIENIGNEVDSPIEGREIKTDPVRGLQSFVEKVISSTKTSTPPTTNVNNIENVLEENLERAFPQFGIDVDIIENSIDDLNGVNFVFNISKKSDDEIKQYNIEEKEMEANVIPQLGIVLDGTEEETIKLYPPSLSPLGIDVDVDANNVINNDEKKNDVINNDEQTSPSLQPNFGLDFDDQESEPKSDANDVINNDEQTSSSLQPNFGLDFDDQEFEPKSDANDVIHNDEQTSSSLQPNFGLDFDDQESEHNSDVKHSTFDTPILKVYETDDYKGVGKSKIEFNDLEKETNDNNVRIRYPFQTRRIKDKNFQTAIKQEKEVKPNPWSPIFKHNSRRKTVRKYDNFNPFNSHFKDFHSVCKNFFDMFARKLYNPYHGHHHFSPPPPIFFRKFYN